MHADEIQVLRQIIEKLLDHNRESRNDLPALFADLDTGSAIDISGLEDQYVQAKLYKIFKIMRLRKSKDNELEFRKKKEKDIHNFSFKKFIEYIIDEVGADSSSSSNSGVSQSDNNEMDEHEDEDFDAGEIATTLETIAQNTKTGAQGQRRSGMIVNQQNIQNAVVAQKIVDMDLGKNFMEETMKINKNEESSDSQDEAKNMIADELEAMFSGNAAKSGSHKNLKTWKRMDKSERQEADVGPEIPDSLKKKDGITYLGAELVEENENDRQENQR